jgi:hypothetical protein
MKGACSAKADADRASGFKHLLQGARSVFVTAPDRPDDGSSQIALGHLINHTVHKPQYQSLIPEPAKTFFSVSIR